MWEGIDQRSRAEWSGKPEDWTGFANRICPAGPFLRQPSATPAQVREKQATEIFLRSCRSVSTTSYISWFTGFLKTRCFCLLSLMDCQLCEGRDLSVLFTAVSQLLHACGFVMWTWWKYGGEREFNVLGREFLGCWTMESEPQRKKVKREAHRSVWRTGVLEINKKSWKYMIVSRDWNISFYKFKGRAIGEPQSPRCSHWSGELQWHRGDCHWGWRGHGYFMAWDTDVEDFTEIF